MSGRANSASGLTSVATSGQSAATFAGSLLEMAASLSPGTPATSGAWKVLVAKP